MTLSFVPRSLMTAGAAVLLAGCASTAIQDNFASAQAVAQDRLGAQVRWLTTPEARAQAEGDVDALLAKPLEADDAVRIALAYSPAFQAMLFDSAASSASITQGARLPNPVFGFERLMRSQAGISELEITRTFALSLYDLVLLPSRLRLADSQQQQARWRLAGEIVQTATDARQAWVRAVAAQQALQYAGQVKTAADAAAELARRMQAAGNFSKLQRAREQAFAADAVAQLARAQQRARSTREALVRVVGLNDAQAGRLTLPDRLPELPKAPRDEQSVLVTAREQRLDVRLAQASLAVTAQQQGLSRVTGFVNSLQVAAVNKGETGLAVQRGYALDVPLPLFDFGDATRARAQATYMAALNRSAQVIVDAGSHVREAYDAYRTADDLARHYRDEIVPLRKTISDENLLRYNGMLIGVFELLADAREQIASVAQAIDAQQDFWLADAALTAALIGRPSAAAMQGANVAERGATE